MRCTPLDRAALLVRRIGVNLNQAVAKLNATGQRSGDLLPYAEESIRRNAGIPPYARSGLRGMSDFGRELARLMQVRGVGVRELARAAYCNPGHVSNLRSGTARPSPQLAETLDRYLGAGGTLAAIAARSAPARGRGRGTRASGPSQAVEALQVAMNGSGWGEEAWRERSSGGGSGPHS
jgi:transcriptional regulator with XRE-family HTH domain